MGILQRAAKILLVCVNLILLSGCWDRTEVNDLALIVGLGIDQKKDGKIMITVELIAPKAAGGGQMLGGGGGDGGGGGRGKIVRSGTGATVADAISNLQEKLPRRVFWGHTKVIVFGERAARAGIRQHLDFLSRNPQARLRSNVLVSKGTAKSVLELIPPDRTKLIRSAAGIVRITTFIASNDKRCSANAKRRYRCSGSSHGEDFTAGKRGKRAANHCVYPTYRHF